MKAKPIRLKEIARKRKVFIELDRQVGGGYWHITSIERDEGSRKGSGATVIRAVIRAAHREEKHVILHPTNKRLRAYYATLGFEEETRKDVYQRTKLDGPISIFGRGMVNRHKKQTTNKGK